MRTNGDRFVELVVKKKKKVVCCCCFCFDRVSLCSPGLELSILLPQPPKCWNYRCALPHLALAAKPGFAFLTEV
jgi:hypothetical protein